MNDPNISKKLAHKTLSRLTQLSSVLVMSLVMAFGSVSPVAAANCNPPTDTGSATMTLNLQAGADYRVWSRMNIPDSANNSFYLSIDGGCAELVGGSTAMKINSWEWVDYKDGNTNSKFNVTLPAGQHTIKAIGNKPGVKLDKVLLLGNSCTPTSMSGSECIDATAPTVSITSPPNAATVSGTGVNIQATASDNASGIYAVLFKIDDDTTPFATDGSAPYTATWNSTSKPDGDHYIKVQAIDGAGNYSSVAQVKVTVANNGTGTDTTAPNAPNNLQISVNNSNQVDLGWDAATDNVGGSGVAGYNVYRDGVIKANKQAATTFSDKTVSADTYYTYEVETVDKAGNVSPRTPIATRTPSGGDTTAPSAPTGVTATADSTSQVTVKWTKSPESDVAKYFVQRDGIVVGTVGATSTSYVDKNLQADTTYTYMVIAQDTAGNSSNGGQAATVKTPPILPPVDVTPPTTPQNFKAAAASSTSALLSWSASTDAGGSGLAGYRVFRDGSQIATVNASTTTFGDATLVPAGTYKYSVKAYDGAGNVSGATPELSVTTPGLDTNTLFSDTFNAGSNQWTKVGTGWNVPNVKDPFFAQTAGGGTLAGAGVATWTDYSVESNVRINTVFNSDSNAYAGVVGRASNIGTYYMASLKPSGSVVLTSYKNGTATQLASKQMTVSLNTWHKLKLQMVGSSLKVFVNDTEQISTTNSDSTAGSIALRTNNAAADFDNVSVVSQKSSTPQTITLTPTDDAWVESAYPSKNHGNRPRLQVDQSPIYHTLMKFRVSGTAGRTIKSAKLRMYATNGSDLGGNIRHAANSNWTESTVTYATAPAAGTLVGQFGSVSSGAYYTADITPEIVGDGIYSLRIQTTSTNGAEYYSKDADNSNKPQLVITVL